VCTFAIRTAPLEISPSSILILRWQRSRRSVHQQATPTATTGREGLLMSAIPPKADIVQHDGHVRFVPIGDIARPLAPGGCTWLGGLREKK
jgi:hypothetical protein